MKLIQYLLYALLGLLAAAHAALGAGVVPGIVEEAKPRGHFYTDAGLTLTTPDFQSESFGYLVGVGYQVSKVWGFDVRATHEGLDTGGSAVQGLGGRVVARLPFEYLSPYTFLGGEFDLERDRWYIQPGAGIELGASKLLKGLSVFAEGALKADTEGSNSYLFTAGARLRF